MNKLQVDGKRAMGETELKQYMKQLRLKTEKYKKCKQMLQLERNEMAIVQRTNEILQSRHPNLSQFLEEKEHEKELIQQRNILEKISAAKNELDLEKERSLTSMAEVVHAIQVQLNLKRHKLQPLVKQLKQSRKEFDIFSKKYNKSSNAYQNMKSGYDIELSKIQENVESLTKVVQNLESRYFAMSTELELKQMRMEKVVKESEYQQQNRTECRLNSKFQCYRDLYESEISKLLRTSKTVKNEQKDIQRTFENDSIQKQYFEQLNDVLRFKKMDVERRMKQVVHNEMDEDGAERMILID